MVYVVLLVSTDKNWNTWPCFFFRFCNLTFDLSQNCVRACSWLSYAIRKQNLAHVVFMYGRPGTASALSF